MPGIRSSLIVVLTTIAIGALKVYDIVAVMTGGRNDTTVLAFEMVNQQQRFQSYGHSAALAVVLFIFVMPLIVFNVRPDQEAEGDALMTIEVIEPIADDADGSPGRPRRPRKHEKIGAEAADVARGDDRGDRHRVLLDDPDVRAASSRSFRPGADTQSTGWWTIFTDPELHARELRDWRCTSGGTPLTLAQSFVNSLAITIPVAVFALVDRVAARLRVRVDRLQGQEHALHRWCSRCRSCRSRWRSCRC